MNLLDGVSTIAEANFYVSGSAGPLRACWTEFLPNHPLWTDGLEKRRWIYLPPGQQIQTGGASVFGTPLTMDRWQFPVGTRFMKEFALPNGRLVETRLWERLEDDIDGMPTYRMGSFLWSDVDGNGPQSATYIEDGADVSLTVEGESFVHRVPNNAECRRCHEGEPGRALGFTATQLAKDEADDINLAGLVASGLLSDVTGYDAAWRFPADDVTYVPGAPPPTREALGALHGNCSHCHNDHSESNAANITTPNLDAPANFELRIRYGQATVSDMQLVRSTVGRQASTLQMGLSLRIDPGNPGSSIVWRRDGLRPGMPMMGMAMPPLGTMVVNEPMQSDVAAWISALP